MLALFLVIMLTEYSNVMYGETLAVTRCDMIADSSAIYAQSYDYNYNRHHAREMTTLLTELNNDAADNCEFFTNISFPSGDVLTIQCVAKVPTTYGDLADKDYYYISRYSSVKSVDVYGDVFVVPE